MPNNKHTHKKHHPKVQAPHPSVVVRMPKHSGQHKEKVRGTHAAPLHHGGDKLRTTQVANLPPGKMSTLGSRKDSEMAAVGVLDPFAAFQRQYKTGLPFSTMTLPSYCFWTRRVTRASELPWTGGGPNDVGIALTISPWCDPQIETATALGAGGQPTTVVGTSDPQLPFITANFENIAVAYQGVRVRNLTSVLQQGGELAIGSASYLDASTLTFDAIRSSSTTITHANGDPGVMAQQAYTGNQSDRSVNPLSVSDYAFSEPTLTIMDPQSRVTVVRSYGNRPTPQVYEIEVVTCYLAVPFAQPSQIFAPVRYEVNPMAVNRLLDRAYAASPAYSIPRNFVKDDGWDTVWTGVKAICTDIGLGIVGSAVSAIGSAFASLFDGKRRIIGFTRLLSLLPPDAYDDFRRILVEHADHAAAMKFVKRPRAVSRFTQAELLEIADFMSVSGTDIINPTAREPTPSTAAAANPGWTFMRK